MIITNHALAPRQLSAPKLATALLSLALIVGSIASFVSHGMLRDTQASFYMFYAAGQLWGEGENPYDYTQFRARFTELAPPTAVTNNSGYYYPPQASALFSALAHMPLHLARMVFLAVNLLLLVVCLLLLAHILARYRTVGLLEITLLVSLINTGFGRVNVRQGQLGLISCCFVLTMFVLATNRRDRWAGIALGAATVKPTFMPVYFAFHLQRRSYRLIIACVLSIMALTILPLLMSHRPLLDTMDAWIRMVRLQGVAGGLDDPSPFVPDSAQMLNLTPLVYRVLNARSVLTTGISWLILIVLGGGILCLLGRDRRSGREELLDFGLVSALSLVSVYHRSYDIFLLFPGLLFLYLQTRDRDDARIRRWWTGFLTLVLLLLSVPGDLAMRLSRAHPALLGQYLWRVVAPFQAWVSLIVLGALLWRKVTISPYRCRPALASAGQRRDAVAGGSERSALG